jgi:HPt (histidine-containing phosphotransfer) domain-containing protein
MSEPFDREALLERIDNDWEFLTELVQMLDSEGRRLLAELKSAAASSDAPAVGRIAHTLKGMISNFCAQSVADAAHSIELSAKSGDLPAALSAIAALEAQLEGLIVALQSFLASRPQCTS